MLLHRSWSQWIAARCAAQAGRIGDQKMLRHALIALSLAPLVMGCAHFAPADYAAAVAAPGRPDAMVALDESRKPAEVLNFLGLRRGDHALDLWSGYGYHTEIMARAVGPEGSVTAWNAPSFAANPRFRDAMEGVRARNSNVTLAATPIEALNFPEAAYDFVLLSLIYHDLYWESESFSLARVDPQIVTAALFRATKPGGVVGVIDHVAAPGRNTRAEVEATHRILPATVRADFERAGFEFIGASDLLRNPADDLSMNVFDPRIRNRTDRIVYRFRRPSQ
jgi:predicted methyltransferase